MEIIGFMNYTLNRVSPGLQRGAEAVRLPVGESDDGDPLLGQQGLRHRDVNT